MIPILAIPTYNQPSLLARCLESIDHPVGRIVIIENGPAVCRHYPAGAVVIVDSGTAICDPVNATVISHPNAGVAASWNEAIKLFPAPYWVIGSDDIAFAPGDLALMEAACSGDDWFCVASNLHFSFFAISRLGVNAVGLFDENFYPAYYEDFDWLYRAGLVDANRCRAVATKALHGFSGESSATIRSTEEIGRKNERTYAHNVEYYKLKWGGDWKQEKFRHPFNDPRLSVDYWKFSPEFREVQQW